MGSPNRDVRDARTWVTFELTRLGEKAAITGDLFKYLVGLFGASRDQVFIPYKVCVCDGKTTVFNALEGYCFVEYVLTAGDYINAITDSPFIRSVLHSRVGYVQTLHTLPDSRIEEIRQELNVMTASSVVPGDRVLISSGTYAGVTGEVLEVLEDSVCLHIKLRSFHAVKVLPKFAISASTGESDE